MPPSNTYLDKNLKLQLSPGLVDSYDIRPRNRVGLFCENTHICLLTYLLTYVFAPDPQSHTGW